MASSPNTKTTLDTLFKYNVADEVNKLVPSISIVQKQMGPLSEALKVGRKFLWPVALTLEHGVTYGDGTVFAYNDDVAAVYGEAQIDSNPIVLKTRVSMEAANRMADDKLSFINEMSLRTGVMKESISKRAEIESLYGKHGLAEVSANQGSGSGVITIDGYHWAPGIWSGMENAVLECRTSGGTLVNTQGDLVVDSIDFDNKKVTLDGETADLDLISDGYSLFPKGAYSNSFYGIHKILENTGSLFNINAGDYNLWKANTLSVAGSLTMSKVLKGFAKASGKGGLQEPAKLYVSSLTYEGLNNDLAALRMFDSSYGAEAENGFEGIKYRGQTGRIEIVAHPMVKEGFAYGLPDKCLKKIGSQEITFGFGGDEYFEKLEGNAGYQLICQFSWSVFITCPAKCVLFKDIVNS